MVSLEKQALLTNEVLNTAYSIEWLGQSYPPFTTPDYAILPFYIDDDPGASQQQLNWTAETTKLWTELECWPATYWESTEWDGIWYFDSGRGCVANLQIQIIPPHNISMDYTGYYTNGYTDGHLQDPQNCPPTENTTHQFLASWAAPLPHIPVNETRIPLNITALFCQTSYYKQQVMVTVGTDGYNPQNSSIQPMSPPEPLTEKEFNSTSFENLIWSGMPLEPSGVITRDYPFESVLQLGTRIDNTGLQIPLGSGMVGYALDGRNELATPFSDPNTLHEGFRRAHKFLFALAVNQLISNGTNVGNSTAVSTFQQSGIIVSRLFSAIVEGLLLVVAIFTISLLWSCRKSTSYLKSNPSSISRLVAIFRNGPKMNMLFRPVDHADEKSLRELFRHDKFRLTRSGRRDSRSLYLEKLDDSGQEHSDKRFDKPTGYYEPIRPTALRKEIGLLFGLVQIGALVGIVYLKTQNDRLNGEFQFLSSCYVPST